MPIQFRTVLAAVANPDHTEDWVVQELDGTLSHEHRPLDRPAEATRLDARNAEYAAMRELLHHEDATPEEKAKAVPVAKRRAGGQAPRAADVTAMEQAKTDADARREG